MQEKSHKFLTPAERILLFIDYQGITKYKFHKKIGVSNGFLDKSKEIRTDNLRKILDKYPIINPLWLINGEGEMLKTSIKNPPMRIDKNIITGNKGGVKLLNINKKNTELNAEHQRLQEENVKLWNKNLELYEENSKLKDDIIQLLKNKSNSF